MDLRRLTYLRALDIDVWERRELIAQAAVEAAASPVAQQASSEEVASSTAAAPARALRRDPAVATPVPEPASIALGILGGTGFAGAIWYRRRLRRRFP